MEYRPVEAPRHRSKLRARCGAAYYGLLRRLLWGLGRYRFASAHAQPLPCVQYAHRTVLLRRLKDVDMRLQHNKIVNLKLAAARLDGIVLQPGEVFSFWRLVGKPTRRKGYIEGMVLRSGRVSAGVGGGLCQMSNLIHWMTLHTPLTVVERHRHGYDVFPDANRTQPFGSGATCFYPHGDLMIRNDTNEAFQLLVRVGGEYLEGEWRAENPPAFLYEVFERNHEMRGEYWGGFSRHNDLFRRILGPDGHFLREEYLLSNSAVMMYSPFLPQSGDHGDYIR
ncbi:MAG TPA: VanW family protein [Oscillospiraceae bacterium]|nr:VanW family protein [Oscillospiraceae bacterium]